MKFSDLINSLENSKFPIVVTGPQRSGTTIATECISKALGRKPIREESFGFANYSSFYRLLCSRKSLCAIQAPNMSNICHLLRKVSVVFMMRSLDDIHASEERVGHDKTDFWKYRCSQYFQPYCGQSPAEVIYQALSVQMDYSDNIYPLDYESLRESPLWVDKELRGNFHKRQTSL